MPNTVFSDLLQHRPSKINGDDYHAGAKFVEILQNTYVD